eukprot:TRINITY_DN7610_c3_g1_i1.p1 TRINITY_DN7610_c3_g1~~TRINITY_DN7610_c3_g1_i1.p1  ORF type:complete len:377 (-),score=54.01 TRINITY_DN7610_c3_g1_i1:31-1161(-)
MVTHNGQATTDVSERHRFDESSLAKYLAKELPSFSGNLTVRKFGSGQSNPTYYLRTSVGQEFVLRKKPPGKAIKGAHAVDREFRVLQALGNAGFEVPGVHMYCDDDQVIGTPFYVMSFVKGIIPDNALDKLPMVSRRPAVLSMVRSLARLHSYDPKQLGLLDGSKPYGHVGGFYERQITTMRRTSEMQVAGSKGQVPPLHSMQELLALFTANLPADKSCLIHGDWKPDNIILSDGANGGEQRVLAVVDWELSTIGHPMSDLANFCLSYHLGPLGKLVSYADFCTDSDSGIPTEDEVHRTYCKAAQIDYPISDWQYFVAFSQFRLAVIIQGVAMRAALGTASQASAAQVGQLSQAANMLVDRALEMMRTTYASRAKL